MLTGPSAAVGRAIHALLRKVFRRRRAGVGGADSARRGAITVEYALVILVAAAILVGVEEEIFRPMAKDILKNFMDFIVKPYP